MLTPIIGLTRDTRVTHPGGSSRGSHHTRRDAGHRGEWQGASPLPVGQRQKKSPRRCRAARVDLIGETVALFEARLRPGRYPRAFGRGQGTGPRVLHLAGWAVRRRCPTTG